MTDSVQVLKPGWRAFDADGEILSGAVLYFYASGTTTPLTVYSNYGLSTSLGTSVTCDSGGYPTSNGTAKVQIYTGASPYKIVLKDSSGATVWAEDNLIGALDTSSFITSSTLTASTPVTNSSSNKAPGLAAQGKFYNLDCSGGDVTVTIVNAATCANGWSIKVRHDGTANQILITGTSSELFKIGGRAGVTAFALARRGQTVTITCDGTGFAVEQSSPALFDTVGIILIADYTATPPGSPQAGERYLLASAPSGAWSTFAQYDIAEYSGSGWFKITPTTDCGWLAYVQDENICYQFVDSAWAVLVPAATTSLAGTVQLANQAAMEALTTGRAVTADVQHFHPGHPKFWALVTVTTGTPALTTSYNVTSITDTATGRLTITIANDFSSSNWCCQATAENSAAGKIATVLSASRAAGSVEVQSWTSADSPTLSDPDAWHVMGLGDL